MSAKIYTVQCTQAEFNKLPGLVTRAVFMDWTGLSKNELGEEVHAGRIAVYKAKKNGNAKYYKHEIARLTNFKM
jgi:hypothetical protein